jgi:hypothetical protein
MELLSIRNVLRYLLPVHEFVALANHPKPLARYDHELVPYSIEYHGGSDTAECMYACVLLLRRNSLGCISDSYRAANCMQVKIFTPQVMFFFCVMWLCTATVLMRFLHARSTTLMDSKTPAAGGVNTKAATVTTSSGTSGKEPANAATE